MNVITKIFEEYFSDDVDTHEQSELLVNHYAYSSKEERAAMDYVLITLCGRSLVSILDMLKKESEEKCSEKDLAQEPILPGFDIQKLK